MNGVLASHYACALADAVFRHTSELKPLEAIEQLRSAESLLSSSRDLQIVLLSPMIDKDRKFALVRELADTIGLHRTICNFLLLVTAHRRTGELKKICTNFETCVDEGLGFIPADISSRRELTIDQREMIERILSNNLGKTIRASYKIDPSLLGGIKASVASKEYDGTVRGRLERLRAHLLETFERD